MYDTMTVSHGSLGDDGQTTLKIVSALPSRSICKFFNILEILGNTSEMSKRRNSIRKGSYDEIQTGCESLNLAEAFEKNSADSKMVTRSKSGPQRIPRNGGSRRSSETLGKPVAEPAKLGPQKKIASRRNSEVSTKLFQQVQNISNIPVDNKPVVIPKEVKETPEQDMEAPKKARPQRSVTIPKLVIEKTNVVIEKESPLFYPKGNLPFCADGNVGRMLSSTSDFIGFAMYMASINAEESINFYKDFLGLQNRNNEEWRKDRIKYIYEKYIDPNSKDALNIDGRTISEIKKKISNNEYEATIFHKAVSETFELWSYILVDENYRKSLRKSSMK